MTIPTTPGPPRRTGLVRDEDGRVVYERKSYLDPGGIVMTIPHKFTVEVEWSPAHQRYAATTPAAPGIACLHERPFEAIKALEGLLNRLVGSPPAPGGG